MGVDSLKIDLASFERAVLEQSPVAPERYDEEYFAAAWRADDNRYDLATRRRIEGPHPGLIRDVFAPARVLDVGCGPGFLLQLLDEVGVRADGVDFAPASRRLAPPEVRDRIRIASMTDRLAAEPAYDLVICREVMEHLTVLQIRRAVSELCHASSQFVYLTTRFHPAPRSLLDFTTEMELDPTHITLLAKDFLRCLFVLEGFGRRSDLEERMDWAAKDRVLVYQRRSEL